MTAESTVNKAHKAPLLVVVVVKLGRQIAEFSNGLSEKTALSWWAVQDSNL
jgi:hypothetical protein